MAKFGKRFRKAKERRQQRRAEVLAKWQEQKTERIGIRQAGKTDRVDSRNLRRANVIQSKSEGGYFLPQSVQARQDSLQTGFGIARDLGSGFLDPLGLANGGQSSPYGSGYATSGMEEEYYPTSQGETSSFDFENLEGWIKDNMILVAVGGAGLIYLLTRKK